MALPKLESFTDTNGTVLTTHDAGWGQADGATSQGVIQGNRLRGNTAAHTSILYWKTDTPGNDQYAQAVASQVDSTGYQGPGVRFASTFQADGYTIDSHSGDRELTKWVASSESILYSDAGTLSNGDLQRIEVAGNVLVYKLNGSSLNGAGTTDNTRASGALALVIYDNQATTEMDDWEGGNLTAAAAQTPYQPWQQRAPILAQ